MKTKENKMYSREEVEQLKMYNDMFKDGDITAYQLSKFIDKWIK